VIPQAIRTQNDYVGFTEYLQEDNPEELTAAKQALEAWEADKNQPDPYRLPKSSRSTFTL
jgi:hypothetical protein